MKVFGIIGLKNSGKTYVVKKIISKLKSLNFKVGSIKHAHHNFDIDKPNTDSYIHRKAGAEQVIISSSKKWVKIIEIENNEEKNLTELLNEFVKIDLVIVEGYKDENHLKIEIIKDPDNTSSYLFKKTKNVIAIISDIKINSFKQKQFKKNQIDQVVNFILNY
ncbi:molybdopterin-guanine dinucleotide biosynthesis protein B [Alphaproteobacteria bacterium]|nr:molybdopterin-guanine dinucleotide biosynthesis protein B [Alphaproteobacteria bacterium]